uniref:Uncharacterized protein n=1 Tax=Chromera velia CCMP2878 TaxID=1169474 RepID=A0A0G4H995_9ALVE|eukprot:Cvel_25371.t1-p1 / transcript=Cvel_25371.t1 / gene=Cvel_25371 / organism=Chromera_velia_CCMP2878 / gene_product=hypothetical protein / transcript_product=hypothetical protein / location=Cvel_scaffold2865:7161-9042(+) / protein_length=589 / sequence_SO=supercontig / SO=protein_coding / is_pseudo=false
MPSVGLLADLVTPFVDGGRFLFYASVCRDFHKAYMKQKKDPCATTLQSVFEDCDTQTSESSRFSYVMSHFNREGDNHNRQTLATGGSVCGRWRKGAKVPAAAFLVFLLKAALKTPQALRITKSIATHLDVPPALLLFAHVEEDGNLLVFPDLEEGGEDRIPTLIATFKEFGLLDDLIELRQMFFSIGLNLTDFIRDPTHTFFSIQAATFIHLGAVESLHPALGDHPSEWDDWQDDSVAEPDSEPSEEASEPRDEKDSQKEYPSNKPAAEAPLSIPPLSPEALAELHNHLCQKSQRDRTAEQISVTKALEEVVVKACVESWRVGEELIWFLLWRRFSEGGSAKRMLEAYVSRLSDFLAAEVPRTVQRVEVTPRWDALDGWWFLRVVQFYCRNQDSGWLIDYANEPTVNSGEDFEKLRLGLLNLCVSVCKEQVQKGGVAGESFSRAFESVLRVLLSRGDVVLLKALILTMGEDAFFHVFMSDRCADFNRYYNKNQIEVIRYLRQLRPEWQPGLPLPKRERVSGRTYYKAVILEDWREVKFLVYECGLSWEYILGASRHGRLNGPRAFLDCYLQENRGGRHPLEASSRSCTV